MALQPMPFQPVTQFQPVTNYLAAIAAKQERDNAKMEMETAKLRNRLAMMQLDEEEKNKSFKSEIATGLLQPQTVKDMSFGVKRLTSVPLSSPGGNMAPGPGVTPGGGINENAIPSAPLLPPSEMVSVEGISPDQAQAIKSVLPDYSVIEEKERQVVPILEEAKALGLNIPEQVIRQNPSQALAYIESKKAESAANLDKKINMIKDLASVNPKMAANLWNADPQLRKMGEYGEQNNVEPEYDENGKLLGTWVSRNGKQEFVKPDQLTEYQKISLSQNKELRLMQMEQSKELRLAQMELAKQIHQNNFDLRKDLKEIRSRIPAAKAQEIGQKIQQLDRYSVLGTDFNDKYAGYKFFGPTVTRAGEKFGFSKDQVNWWKQFKMLDVQLRHELFGATLTGNEQKAWDSVTVSENSDPSIIREAIITRSKIAKDALNREVESYSAAGYNTENLEKTIPAPTAPRANNPVGGNPLLNLDMNAINAELARRNGKK